MQRPGGGIEAGAGEPRVLIVKAKGGFGNRILSAATGIVIADLVGRTPVIDWRDGMYLPPGTNAYPILFQGPPMPVVDLYDTSCDVAPALWSGRLAEHPVDLVERFYPDRHSSPFIYRRLSIDLAHPDVDEPVAVFWSYLPKFARLRSQLRSRPEYRGRRTDEIVREILQRYFTPNPRVRAAVDDLFAGRDAPVIGVHVRYTDRKAPLEAIEKQLLRLQRKLPRSSIFLATDSEMVQSRILAKFPGTFVIDKSMGAEGGALHVDAGFDDPVAEAENALVDMWALARCDWLIHSRNSTFSVAAALIGNIPASRQIDVDRYNARVVAKRWVQAYA